MGDVVRRLVARTVAATAPHQYALSTRAGSECIAHVIQGLTELNPEATVLSIDGMSAYDQISRAAMMDGLFSLCGGRRAGRPNDAFVVFIGQHSALDHFRAQEG